MRDCPLRSTRAARARASAAAMRVKGSLAVRRGGVRGAVRGRGTLGLGRERRGDERGSGRDLYIGGCGARNRTVHMVWVSGYVVVSTFCIVSCLSYKSASSTSSHLYTFSLSLSLSRSEERRVGKEC